jgi:GNAT superfamily N-acetyltransferase
MVLDASPRRRQTEQVSEEENLESGYGPAAPPGDNFCNDFQQETARSYAELARARGDRHLRRPGVVTMTDSGTPLPFWNRAVVEQPIIDASETAAELHAFYGGRGVPYLVDSAWPTPDLRGEGFHLMGHPPLMVRMSSEPPPPPPADLTIVEVHDAQTAEDAERTLVDGYPAPMFQPFSGVSLFTPEVFGAAGWHHFVGYADGGPVAAGSCYVGQQLLRVENIATLPSVRGRGFGFAITAATINADLSRRAVLVASDLGRPVYEKLGFVATQRVTYWIGSS